MSDHLGPVVAAEVARRALHPYAGHPASAALADHYISWTGLRGLAVTAPCRCDCGWTGPSCDHPAHLAEALDQAGLLAPGMPPETPTTWVLAERADRRTTMTGCTCPRTTEGHRVVDPYAWVDHCPLHFAERADRRTT